jgi:pyruvate dehydrogenase E2 component (dihydrolipoamide acetyltransferase)
MARVDVIMPQMGESIAEGTLSKWLKKVGDPVKRDEPIFEISTDKVDAEIPAPSAGILAEIITKEGETVPVNFVVARIETDANATIDTSASAPAPAADAAAKAPAATPAPSTAAAAPAAPSNGMASRAATSAAANDFETRLKTKSSPLVRKMAAEHGIDITAMQGSGIAGRVTKKDLLEYIASPQAAASAGTVASRPSMYAPGGVDIDHPLPEPWPGDRVEPMSKMRALISDHMVHSRRTSAHVTSFMEIDFTRVAKIRAAKRREFEAATGEKLSFMPFIIKATVDAIKKFPIVNSSVAGTDIIYRRPINIGIAVALDWGLIVPVIKNADDLSLTGTTRALNDLANRARSKKLAPDEVEGGTFTITNPGVFGSLTGTPIINQPQVAILCIGTIEKRAKVITGADGEDTIAIRTCSYFSLSFDHRVIDGATADQFMATIKRNIEQFPENGVL